MKHLHTFESFLNENAINESVENTHINNLLSYLLDNHWEDEWDSIITKIQKVIKKYDYNDIPDDKIDSVKEIVKKMYDKLKLIDDKFLKNTAKKNEPIISAMKWLSNK
jgi:hypothetical protein